MEFRSFLEDELQIFVLSISRLRSLYCSTTVSGCRREKHNNKTKKRSHAVTLMLFSGVKRLQRERMG